MDAAWEAGITTFDTADAYGGGRSESFIGDWLRTKGPEVRDEIVLTTKTFNPMDEGEDHGLAPARVRRQLESSLRRLGVERVQLYLTHAPDPDVPIAETLGVLDELVAARARSVRTGQQRRRRRSCARRSPSAPITSAGCRTRTRCSTARPSAKCCRSAPSTASASRRSARSRAAG